MRVDDRIGSLRSSLSDRLVNCSHALPKPIRTSSGPSHDVEDCAINIIAFWTVAGTVLITLSLDMDSGRRVSLARPGIAVAMVAHTCRPPSSETAQLP